MAQKTRQSSKKTEEELVKGLKKWQKIEDDAMCMAKSIQSKTNNSLIKLIMEIIAHDSAMHRRVQQFIVDSIEKEAIVLQPEDLESIWDIVEGHLAIEREVIGIAENLKSKTRLFVQRYLINYLLEDERKHDSLLDRLEEIKMKMHPYAS